MDREPLLEKKECLYEGMTYLHGTGLCVARKCMLCENGQWEEDTTIWQSPPPS